MYSSKTVVTLFGLKVSYLLSELIRTPYGLHCAGLQLQQMCPAVMLSLRMFLLL